MMMMIMTLTGAFSDFCGLLIAPIVDSNMHANVATGTRTVTVQPLGVKGQLTWLSGQEWKPHFTFMHLILYIDCNQCDHACSVSIAQSNGRVDGKGRVFSSAKQPVSLLMKECYCAGSSLAWGLSLRAVVCGIL